MKSAKAIMKSTIILVLVILTTLFTIGCTRQEDRFVSEPSTVDSEQQNSSEGELEPETETGTGIETDAVTDTAPGAGNITETGTETNTGKLNDEPSLKGMAMNNGGLYVSYNGNLYYRQYTTDSYASEGIFGTYEANIGVNKNMMCKGQDKTAEIAFSDTGEGKIYIYKDRMYLEKLNEDYLTIVYAVNLDGSNEKEIGIGWIKGIDEETGTLIGVLADDKDTYQLHRIDGVTGEVKKYDLTVPCSEFLAIKDGVIYYSGEVEFEASQLGKVKLCSVNIDGTNEKLLADTNSDLYEYGQDGTTIPCIQFVGDTVYFAYGAYGGTGHFYQGGKIARVNKNGSEFSILLGNSEIGEDNYINMVDDIFYVVNDRGEELLYYSQSADNKLCNVLYLNTQKIEEANFPIYAEGNPFEYKNGISIYLDAAPKMTNWIPFINYDYLDLTEAADYYTIKDIELCDNWVYYRLEANDQAPEASIGWRDGYRRVKTKVLREELDGEIVETLFEY